MRAKKSFKNMIFNALQQVIAVITNFILPPMIIATFGSAMNGLVQTIKQFVQYARMAGAGISSASTFALYKPLAERNVKELSGTFNSSRKMFNKAGNILSCLVLCIAIFYSLYINKTSDINYIVSFMLVLIIGACGLSEFYLLGKYQALFNADLKGYIVSIAQMVGNIFNIVISVLLIKLGLNIVWVQIGATSVYLLRIIILTWFYKKNYNYIDLKEKPLDEKLSQRKDAIIHEITALVVNSSSVLLISLMIGLESASVYSVYLLVFAGLNTICSVVYNSITPSLGNVIANKETEVLHNSFNAFEYVYFISISVIYTITAIMIMPFISVYTTNLTDINYYLPLLGLLFVFLGFINNAKLAARTVIQASGKFKETKKYSLIEMIINIVGQVVFILIWGIYGALAGCVLAAIYRMINMIWYCNKKLLNISIWKTYKRLLINFILGIGIVLFVYYFVDFTVTNYISWFIYAFIFGTIVLTMFLLLNYCFEKEMFNKSLKIIKNIFKVEKKVINEK